MGNLLQITGSWVPIQRGGSICISLTNHIFNHLRTAISHKAKTRQTTFAYGSPCEPGYSDTQTLYARPDHTQEPFVGATITLALQARNISTYGTQLVLRPQATIRPLPPCSMTAKIQLRDAENDSALRMASLPNGRHSYFSTHQLTVIPDFPRWGLSTMIIGVANMWSVDPQPTSYILSIWLLSTIWFPL